MKTMTRTLVWLGISLMAATTWASGGFQVVRTAKISDGVARAIQKKKSMHRVRFVDKNTIAAKRGNTLILNAETKVTVLLGLEDPGDELISKMGTWTKNFPAGDYVTYICACSDDTSANDDDCDFSGPNASGCKGSCSCAVTVFYVDVNGTPQKVDTF